ncbi:MAG: RNA-binding S4 domain-containing protein [Acidobacteria bacterium]|nr:RNA-binding S4 domain-containing protein [Acidobacteriota bacterium]
MRLDRFLKNTRLEKRRAVAKRDADSGRILLNGRPAKPGKDVRPGDVLTVVAEEPDGGASEIVYEVLALPEHPVQKGQEPLYYKRKYEG